MKYYIIIIKLYFILGFTDLSLNDQMRLLQTTWAELLTLTTAFRSLEQFSNKDTDRNDNIDSLTEQNNDIGLKLRYATDYWLDKQLANECCLVNVESLSSPNDDGMAKAPSVMDIYNLVRFTVFLS